MNLSRSGGFLVGLCAAVWLGACSSASAQAAPETSQPSRLGEATPDRWSLDAGLALRERPGHIGARSYVTDVWPVVELQYGTRLHISLDDGVKWSAIKSGPFAIGPVAEYRQAYNDKLPPRTEKLSDAVELGGFTQVATPFGVAEARLRRAVSGYDGLSADLAFDTGAPLTRQVNWTLEARTSWVDRDFITRESNRRRGSLLGSPKERTQDFVTAGLQAGVSATLPRNLTLTALVSEDRLLSHLPPRFSDTRNLLGFSLIVTHRWGGRAF